MWVPAGVWHTNVKCNREVRDLERKRGARGTNPRSAPTCRNSTNGNALATRARLNLVFCPIDRGRTSRNASSEGGGKAAEEGTPNKEKPPPKYERRALRGKTTTTKRNGRERRGTTGDGEHGRAARDKRGRVTMPKRSTTREPTASRSLALALWRAMEMRCATLTPAGLGSSPLVATMWRTIQSITHRALKPKIPS